MTRPVPTPLPPARAASPSMPLAARRHSAICSLALVQALFDGAWIETRIEQIVDRVGGLA
ncbi:hypothetical protein ACFQXB_00970 [Plastorhodobacter daqingensis]|uniref:Uncharacterized protein n=1 Tax=Plastorhodobacter daqingensis TaxID=1387281 RepID=A0ABW2UF36_9RHOB